VRAVPHTLAQFPRRSVAVIAFAVIVVMMKWAAAVIVPLLLATLIAIIVLPIARSRWLPERLRVPMALLTPVAATVGCGWLLVSSITDLVAALPQYEGRLDDLRTKLSAWLYQHRLGALARHIARFDGGEMVKDILGTGLVELVHVIAMAAFSGMLTFFIIAEAHALPRKMKLLGGGGRAYLEQARAKLHDVQRYVIIKTWLCLGTGVAAGVLTKALGVPHWELWALLTFLLTYVPFIGPIIAAVPAIAVALVTRGPTVALLVLVGFLVIKVLFGYILEPKLTGESLGLSPLVVLLSIVFWGWVLGSVGALVSVPLTMIARMLLLRSHEWRWLALLLGSVDEAEREAEAVTSLHATTPTPIAR
jgi:AI-2 transport protein TqsA